MADSSEETDGGSKFSPFKDEQHEALTTFTLAFVLAGGSGNSERFVKASRAAADAWNYEQQRCGFVSREVRCGASLVSRWTIAGIAEGGARACLVTADA